MTLRTEIHRRDRHTRVDGDYGRERAQKGQAKPTQKVSEPTHDTHHARGRKEAMHSHGKAQGRQEVAGRTGWGHPTPNNTYAEGASTRTTNSSDG